MEPNEQQMQQARTIIQQVAVNTDKVIADVAQIIAERAYFRHCAKNGIQLTTEE
jgi:hypothetical protein